MTDQDYEAQQQQLAAELGEKLLGIAMTVQTTGVFSDQAIATGFLGASIGVASELLPPDQVVTWLRETADALEARGNALGTVGSA